MRFLLEFTFKGNGFLSCEVCGTGFYGNYL